VWAVLAAPEREEFNDIQRPLAWGFARPKRLIVFPGIEAEASMLIA